MDYWHNIIEDNKEKINNNLSNQGYIALIEAGMPVTLRYNVGEFIGALDHIEKGKNCSIDVGLVGDFLKIIDCHNFPKKTISQMVLDRTVNELNNNDNWLQDIKDNLS